MILQDAASCGARQKDRAENRLADNEFILSARGLIKRIVDTIATKEYRKLVDFAQIDSSWLDSGQAQKEIFVEMRDEKKLTGKWYFAIIHNKIGKGKR